MRPPSSRGPARDPSPVSYIHTNKQTDKEVPTFDSGKLVRKVAAIKYERGGFQNANAMQSVYILQPIKARNNAWERRSHLFDRLARPSPARHRK